MTAEHELRLDPLSSLARRYFEALPGAGSFPAGTPGVVSGEAGSRAVGTHVRMHMRFDGDVVAEVRFQAFGCPHTLAVAAWVAERLTGTTRELRALEAPQEWLRRFDAPIEKLGRLLIIEDAVRNALQARASAAVE